MKTLNKIVKNDYCSCGVCVVEKHHPFGMAFFQGVCVCSGRERVRYIYTCYYMGYTLAIRVTKISIVLWYSKSL